MLMTACILTCSQWIIERRRKIRLAVEFASALERIAGKIRWQNLSLLRGMEQEIERHPCGTLFSLVCKEVKSGQTLQKAWEKVFASMADQTTSELLAGVELQGDARQIMGSLYLAAESLRSHAALLSEKQRQSERLCLAIGGCLTAVLVIILI